MNKQKEKGVSVFIYEQRLLSHIRTVKLVRDIANGTQMRLTKWVF